MAKFMSQPHLRSYAARMLVADDDGPVIGLPVDAEAVLEAVVQFDPNHLIIRLEGRESCQ